MTTKLENLPNQKTSDISILRTDILVIRKLTLQYFTDYS